MVKREDTNVQIYTNYNNLYYKYVNGEYIYIYVPE